MKTRITRLLCAGLSYLPVLLEAAETPRRFAAPEVAASPPAGSAGGIGQVMLALLVVLVAVFATALVFKRLRGFNASGNHGIEVLAQASLGAKERAVIVRVAGSRLLLGVSTGHVSLLQTLPAEPDAPPSPDQLASQAPRFAELLRRSLGK